MLKYVNIMFNRIFLTKFKQTTTPLLAESKNIVN